MTMCHKPKLNLVYFFTFQYADQMLFKFCFLCLENKSILRSIDNLSVDTSNYLIVFTGILITQIIIIYMYLQNKHGEENTNLNILNTDIII